MKLYLTGNRSREVKVKEYVVPVLSGTMIVFGAAYPVLTLACFAMNLAYVFFASAKETYRLLFILLPFTQVYKFAALGTVSLFTVLELFAVIVLLLKLKKINVTFLALLLVWAAYVLLGSQQDYLMWIKQMLVPLLIYLFFRHEQMSFKELVISLSVGLILSSIFAMYREAIPGLEDIMRITRLWEADGIVYRLSGLYPDPNYYTTMIILCSVALLTMYACRTMGWEALALFGILTIWGAATGSKSYLLMLCAILGLFTVCLFITKRYAVGMLALVAFALFGIAVFSGRIEMFNNIVIRLLSDNRATGRMDLWEEYIHYLNQDWIRWIFGVGIGADSLDSAAHNTYLDFAYFYGLVGTVIWLVLCSKAVGRIRIPNIYISSLPLICLIVLSMFLSYVVFYDFPFAVIFVVYALKTDFQNSNLRTG